MNDLPDPLTSAEDDVEKFAWFKLDTAKLISSELWALASPEEFGAAVKLWVQAWRQKPAGSLPDSDKVLAAFSGTGTRWPEVRDVALHGFIKCSDGRLYHKTLCAEVKGAAEKHAENDRAAQRKAKEREERSQLFARLKEEDVTPPWNTTTRELRALVQNLSHDNVGDTSSDRPRPVTAREGEGREKDDTIREIKNIDPVPLLRASPETSSDLQRLEQTLRAAAGWENETHPNLFVTGSIAQLIRDGCDIDLDVVPVVRARAPSIKHPNNWKYFIAPIREARDNRLSTNDPMRSSSNGQNTGNRRLAAAQRLAERVSSGAPSEDGKGS